MMDTVKKNMCRPALCWGPLFRVGGGVAFSFAGGWRMYRSEQASIHSLLLGPLFIFILNSLGIFGSLLINNNLRGLAKRRISLKLKTAACPEMDAAHFGYGTNSRLRHLKEMKQRSTVHGLLTFGSLL